MYTLFLCAIALLFSAQAGRSSEPAAIRELERAVRSAAEAARDGEQPKARAIIEDVEARIHAELADPYDAARAWADLGVAFNNFGRYRDAENALLRCLALMESLGEEVHLARLLATNNLVTLHINYQQFAKAEQVLKRIPLEDLSADDLTSMLVFSNVATVAHYSRDFPKAETFYKRALKVHSRLEDDSLEAELSALMGLAGVYASQKRFPKAIRLFEEARKLLRTADAPVIYRVRNLAGLGVLHHGAGRFDEAAPFFEQALETACAKLGHDHPVTGEVLSRYGDLMKARGQKAEAKRMWKRAREILTAHQRENGLHHTVDIRTLLANHQ